MTDHTPGGWGKLGNSICLSTGAGPTQRFFFAPIIFFGVSAASKKIVPAHNSLKLLIEDVRELFSFIFFSEKKSEPKKENKSPGQRAAAWARKRLQRDRERRGLRRYVLYLPEIETNEKLVTSGFLDPLAADIHERAEEALTELVLRARPVTRDNAVGENTEDGRV